MLWIQQPEQQQQPYTMCRASWLQSSGIPRDLQVKAEDLPFDREKLFSKKIDEVLYLMKDSRAILEPLGSRQLLPSIRDTSNTNVGESSFLCREFDTHKQKQRPPGRKPSQTKTSSSQPALVKWSFWSLGRESERPYPPITINPWIFGHWFHPF